MSGMEDLHEHRARATTRDPLSDWFRRVGTQMSDEDYEEGHRLLFASERREWRVSSDLDPYYNPVAFTTREEAAERARTGIHRLMHPRIQSRLVTEWVDGA